MATLRQSCQRLHAIGARSSADLSIERRSQNQPWQQAGSSAHHGVGAGCIERLLPGLRLLLGRGGGGRRRSRLLLLLQLRQQLHLQLRLQLRRQRRLRLGARLTLQCAHAMMILMFEFLSARVSAVVSQLRWC